MPKGSSSPPSKGVSEPPDDKRCTYTKKTGTRCKMWAKKGTQRCWKHTHFGGTNQTFARGLPMFYSRCLRGTLRQQVEESLGKPRSEQVELYEELALLRSNAGNAVALFSAAVDNGKPELIVNAGQIMQQHLEAVAEMATKIARIEQAAGDTFNVHTLNGIIVQITQLFYSVCGEQYIELAQVFETRMKNEIVLPSIEQEGTDLRPDSQVIAMNESVPDGPPDSSDSSGT